MTCKQFVKPVKNDDKDLNDKTTGNIPRETN